MCGLLKLNLFSSFFALFFLARSPMLSDINLLSTSHTTPSSDRNLEISTTTAECNDIARLCEMVFFEWRCVDTAVEDVHGSCYHHAVWTRGCLVR